MTQAINTILKLHISHNQPVHVVAVAAEDGVGVVRVPNSGYGLLSGLS